MMEPTGVMDNKRQRLHMDSQLDSAAVAMAPAAGADDNYASDFTVCDLGDEEVHFSRHSSDFYYYRQQQQQQHHHHHHLSDHERKLSSVSESHQQQRSAAMDNRKASTFSALDAGHFGATDATFYHQQNPYVHHGEQISSSRLLNSLGSKLRRGSNYLNAPTRLLGQYLLGITIQSWSEFVNTSRMMKVPTNRHQLTRRLLTNLSYFQGNYLCVSLILVIYCILTSPLLLVAIAAYLLALYLVTARSALGKQTRVFGYRLNLQQQYSFITMLSLPPMWIAGAPSAVFWVIGASFFVVGLHASMFANEQPVGAEHQLASSSRASQSLAVHTPIQYVNQQQQSYIQLGGGSSQHSAPSASAQSTAQYYNHYPGMAKSGYIPVGLSPKVANQASTGGYVTSALSQWIPFGGGGGSSKRSSLSSQIGADGSTRGAGADKTPEVKIISRDYAGLGRVYEV